MSKVYAFVLGILVGGLLTVAICLLTMPGRPRHHHHHHESSGPGAAVPMIAGLQIEELTSPEQVEALLSGDQPAVVMVHSPHCGHCVAMKPNFEAAAKSRRSQVRVARIDARVAGSDFMKKHEIRGVPHVIGHRAGQSSPIKYTGDRSAKSLTDFIESMA